MSSFSLFSVDTWPHNWIEDIHRTPIFTFELSSSQQKYGLYLQSVPLWLELLPIIVIEAFIAALISIPLYYCTAVVPAQARSQSQQQQKQNGNHPTTITSTSRGNNNIISYLLVYGILIPFWLLTPKPLLDSLGIRMKIARFCVAVISPILFIFRSIAVVHGFAPKHATLCLRNFMLYMGCPMILLYDKKKQCYVKTTIRQTMRVFGRYLFWCFVCGMWQSCFFVFPNHFPTVYSHQEEPINKDEWYHPNSFLSLQNWIDGAKFALLMQLYLTAYGEGLVLATSLITWIQSQPIMDNPMLASISPSDFWGRRWNLLIHDCLKNGVYKPIMSQKSWWGSKALAVTAAFTASGLFHEWLLPIVFIGYPISHGTTFMFFMWQGILISIEAAIGHWSVFRYLSRTLPTPIKTLCVILLGLPWAHWFSEPYINSDFFIHGRMTLPCILPVIIAEDL